ncbi:MAG: class I SAM-dependent methyltransferase [Desulfobaccales bacterium]
MSVKLKDTILYYLIDKYCLHWNAYTWYRHRLIEKFMIIGGIKVLNIGTGGGIETLSLLRRDNFVTTIEIDEKVACKTLDRVRRHGFEHKHIGLTGHILEVNLKEKFHEILMCEVLEHIRDDRSALTRISNWLLPGGRLILSTPTASYGQLSIQPVEIDENGGHVRVGYDGPELDQMLKDVGMFTLRRIYNGNSIIKSLIYFENRVGNFPITRPIGYCVSFIFRLFFPFLDLFEMRPYDQITLAIKKYW